MSNRRPKPKKDEVPQPTPLGRGDAFYIEKHFGVFPPARIASDLGVSLDRVEAYIAELVAAGVTPNKKQTKVQRAGFAQKDGVVMATQTSSMLADETRGSSPFTDRRPAVRKARVNPDVIRNDDTE